MTPHPPILLVEDNSSHVLLVRRFLAKGGLANPIHAWNDGADAIAYLQGIGEYADRSRHPLPALVITDLGMAGVGGMEVLRATRETPGLGRTPVVVMSGSTEESDIDKVYRLGATAYLLKPVAFEALLDVIRRLEMPWALQRLADEGNS